MNNTTISREDHLMWCKERANQVLGKGDTIGAFTSFQSDMSKHPDTKDHIALQMGTMLLVSGNLNTLVEMKNWIDGFN